MADKTVMADPTPLDLRTALRLLIEEHQTDAASLSRQIGRSKDYIRDFLEGRKATLPLEALVKIEEALSLNTGVLLGLEFKDFADEAIKNLASRIISSKIQSDESGVSIGETVERRLLPVYSYKDGLDGTLFVSRNLHHTMPRPSLLENSRDAYAVIVEGEIMTPAYDPGDLILINPNISFRINADVLLFGHVGAPDLPDDEFQRCALRRLVGYDQTSWHVLELSPTRQATFPRERWPRLSRVVGKFSKA